MSLDDETSEPKQYFVSLWSRKRCVLITTFSGSKGIRMKHVHVQHWWTCWMHSHACSLGLNESVKKIASPQLSVPVVLMPVSARFTSQMTKFHQIYAISIENLCSMKKSKLRGFPVAAELRNPGGGGGGVPLSPEVHYNVHMCQGKSLVHIWT